MVESNKGVKNSLTLEHYYVLNLLGNSDKTYLVAEIEYAKAHSFDRVLIHLHTCNYIDYLVQVLLKHNLELPQVAVKMLRSQYFHMMKELEKTDLQWFEKECWSIMRKLARISLSNLLPHEQKYIYLHTFRSPLK